MRSDDREIIGRGTWIDKVVDKLMKREGKLGRGLSLIRTESGLGASGIPHVGSMADAVRAYAVSLGLRDRGYNSENIAFSDDMDGLRSVPKDLPSELEEFLLKPVSLIPDPFGCHESFGAHTTGLLLEALDRVGVEYIHYSAYEVYRKGVMKDIIRDILLNWKRAGDIIYEETGQEKFLRYLPYFAICEKCGRIYSTVSLYFDEKNDSVKYRCIGAEIKGKWFPGCGHEGYAKIDRADGKLAWKAEFAARWKYLDIRFEAYGKDIADSVRVSDRVSAEILNYPPPLHVRYELFLDITGRKISKSRGEVFTPQMWLKYGSPESLILYFLKRFVGTRRISFETVVHMMRELDIYKDIYYGRIRLGNPLKEARIKGLLEYSHHLKEVPPVKVPYTLVLSLASAAPEGIEKEFIVRRLNKYGYTGDGDIESIVEYAVNWVRDMGKPPSAEAEIEMNEVERKAIEELIKEISKLERGEDIQTAIFDVSRKFGISPRRFFKILYQIILGRDRGPRLGPLIEDMGVENVIKRFSEVLE